MKGDPVDFPKLDKSVLEVTNIDDEDAEEKRYWHAQTPHKRLEALETLRRLNYGEEAASARLQRFLEVTQREWG